MRFPSDGGASSTATSELDETETHASTPPPSSPCKDQCPTSDPSATSNATDDSIMESHGVRYPKRKREQVKYYDSGDEHEEGVTDDVDEDLAVKVSLEDVGDRTSIRPQPHFNLLATCCSRLSFNNECRSRKSAHQRSKSHCQRRRSFLSSSYRPSCVTRSTSMH